MLAIANCFVACFRLSSHDCQSVHWSQVPTASGKPANVPSYREPSPTPFTHLPQSTSALLHSPAPVMPNASMDVFITDPQVEQGRSMFASIGVVIWLLKQR
jgi:hypothetical protein